MAKIIKNPLTIVSDGGGGTLITKSITANGTYDAQDDSADGYSEVVVNVPPTLFRSLVDRSITSVTAEDLAGVTEIGNYIFRGCGSLTSVIFSASVSTVGSDAFRDCSSLTTVIFPNGLLTIGSSAFYPDALTEIILPDTVTTVNSQAFRGCTAAKKLVIGAGVTSIAFQAFYQCTSFKIIAIKATTPPTLANANAFSSTGSCPIYVFTPDSYKVETNWLTYASRFSPLVSTVADLSSIDTTTYTKACVIGTDESYKEYTYDGSQWNEVT